jgi:hypothetical protein
MLAAVQQAVWHYFYTRLNLPSWGYIYRKRRLFSKAPKIFLDADVVQESI